MTSNYPETTNFGLVRFGEGESIAKQNYGVSDGNVVAIDRILKMLADHDHTGGARLADPALAPELTASTSGGTLPAGQTYYYQVSFVDAYGLETAASPEVSITTPPPLGVPTAPALSVQATGGTLGAGIYRYVLAARTPGGGVTTTSTTAEVAIDTGTTNRILISLPEMPAGAEALLIYRSRPGQTEYYFWRESLDAADLYDDGSVAEDPTILAPAYNTSSGTNSITVSLPGGTVPTGVQMWRIYRASSPGIYNGLNLVHQVSEGLTESDTTPRPDWIDDGSPLFRGQPRRTSATVAPPPAVGGSALPAGGSAGQVLSKIDAVDYNTEWVDAAAGAGGGGTSVAPIETQSTWAPGPLVIGKVYDRVYASGWVLAARMAAYFQDPPTLDPNGAQVGFALSSPDYPGEFQVGGGAPGIFKQFWTPSSSGIAGETYAAEAMPGLDPSRIITDPEAEPSLKAVRLGAQTEYVEMNLGGLPKDEYTCDIYVKTEGAAIPAAGDLQIRLHNQTTNTDLLTQTITPMSYSEAGDWYGIYTLRFTAPGPQYPANYDPMELRVRVTKMLADSTTYLVDEAFVRPAQGTIIGYADNPIQLRAVLTDSPNFPLGPTLDPVRSYIKAEDFVPPRLYIREGLETTAQFGWGTRVPQTSVAWTAASSQSWCTVFPASGTDDGAVLTVTVDTTGFAAGSRHTANITVSASGYTSLVKEVVVLMAPTDLGGDANVHISTTHT